MQKNLYLIIILFSLTSCYTYQVKKQVDPEADNQKESKNNAAFADNPSVSKKNNIAEARSLNPQQTPVPINIQQKLTPNKNFKIDVEGKTYKIIVDRWESDTLVAHSAHKPNKILKFHKNQINGDKIAEKRFSQPIADIITVAVYAGIGVAIWSLLR